jgi:hypothetical protein
VNLVGADYFGNVVSVVMPSASEDDLIHIGQLDGLKLFQIDKSDMTDAGLAHLSGDHPLIPCACVLAAIVAAAGTISPFSTRSGPKMPLPTSRSMPGGHWRARERQQP